MIVQLKKGVPRFIANFGDTPTPVYFRVLKAGNVRWSSSKDELTSSSFSDAGIQEGIPQNINDGEKERFWPGELHAICDDADTVVMVYPPQYNYYILRGNQTPGLI